MYQKCAQTCFFLVFVFPTNFLMKCTNKLCWEIYVYNQHPSPLKSTKYLEPSCDNTNWIFEQNVIANYSNIHPLWPFTRYQVKKFYLKDLQKPANLLYLLVTKRKLQ